MFKSKNFRPTADTRCQDPSEHVTWSVSSWSPIGWGHRLSSPPSIRGDFLAVVLWAVGELTVYRGRRWGCLGGHSYGERNGVGQVRTWDLSRHENGPSHPTGSPKSGNRHSEEGAAGQVMGPALPQVCPKPEHRLHPQTMSQTHPDLSDKDFSGSVLAWPPGPTESILPPTPCPWFC